MTKTQKERTKAMTETVAKIEQKGAPIQFVVAHYLTIGERGAQSINAERIAQEVKRQKQEEENAEKEGMICLLTADFVRALLEGCQILANTEAWVRYGIIKKYL